MKMENSRKIKKILQYILLGIYFLVTGAVPVIVFGYVFFLEGAFIFALAIGYMAFIGMDIICYISEILVKKAYRNIREIRLAKIREKENKMKKLENLLQEKNNYKNEITDARQRNKEFRKKLEKNDEYISKKVQKALMYVCDKMDRILDELDKDPDEFYPIRHTFKVYYPEFIRMTYKFIEISKAGNLERNNVEDFSVLVSEIKQYLDFAESQINSSDKLSLNVGIKALVSSLEAERKRVEKYDERK